MWGRLSAGFALVGIVILVGASIATGSNYPDSRKGFEKQFEDVYKAYKKGDGKQLRGAFARFAISKEWFTETFGADNGPTLAKQYEEQFENFQRSTVGKLDSFGAKASTSLDVKPYRLEHELNPPPVPAPPSLKPLPEVQRFQMVYTVVGGVPKSRPAMNRASWMDTFIYVDGAFRYFGSGAYPFWVALRMYPPDPCAKAGDPKGGEVLERVEPVYPEAAKKRGVEGIVRAVVLVGVDGTAKEVSVTQGDPALVEAAKDAMLRWKFRPFMNCGKPVEGRTSQHVKFPPDG